MKITHKDALKVLNLNSAATFADIKAAYRKACSEYHPDRNTAGQEMMKLVNCAYDPLQDYVATSTQDTAEEATNYGADINAALNAIINLGLDIEICGAWVWVGGDTRAHKEILKEAGFKWAPKKMLWHFRPADYKSFSRGKWSMEQIRDAHGSQKIKPRFYQAIEKRA